MKAFSSFVLQCEILTGPCSVVAADVALPQVGAESARRPGAGLAVRVVGVQTTWQWQRCQRRGAEAGGGRAGAGTGHEEEKEVEVGSASQRSQPQHEAQPTPRPVGPTVIDDCGRCCCGMRGCGGPLPLPRPTTLPTPPGIVDGHAVQAAAASRRALLLASARPAAALLGPAPPQPLYSSFTF